MSHEAMNTKDDKYKKDNDFLTLCKRLYRERKERLDLTDSLNIVYELWIFNS